MRKILLLSAIPLLALALPACDSPDDEAELQALVEDAEVQFAAEVQTAEDMQGSPASGLELDVITNAPHPVAALPNQLCRTNSVAKLFSSPYTWSDVPSNALVRILDYRGEFHYLARYDGKTGQLERSRVIQASCYYQ